MIAEKQKLLFSFLSGDVCIHACMCGEMKLLNKKKTCMAALLSLRMMLLAKPFVWTCQSEHAVCVYHADTRILAVRTMYQLSVGGLWVINHHKVGDTQE